MKRIIALLLLPGPVWAQPTGQQLDMATSLGSLLFVIVLILLLAWLLKKMKAPVFSGQKGLNIVRQLPVGTKERVMIIQAGEEQYLIGVTSQTIQMLAKLDTPLPREESASSPFSVQLSQLLKKNETS